MDIKLKCVDEAGEVVGGSKPGEAAGEKQRIRGGGPKLSNKTTFFTTNSYPETENEEEKLGLTIKGTSEEFKTAHAKIALLLGKIGEEVRIDKI